MRKTLGVCLLVLLLTGSARAGIIPNDAPAPPPPTSVVQEPTDAPTVGGIMTNDAPDSLTQTVLDLLALLPSLL
jgi:hypothetical protein